MAGRHLGLRAPHAEDARRRDRGGRDTSQPLRCTLILALTLALTALAERRGAVAFHYGPALTRAQLDFFGRFDVLITHDPLPREQVAELHERGTKLALYEWSVAFYASRPQSLPVLNRTPLRGHTGADNLDAYYFDPAAPDFALLRTNALVSRLREIQYDGVFFDTTTEESVHPEALAEFRRRHPDVAYDAAFAQFLAALRSELPLIVTNQGYRAAEHYLPYADYDVTESLFVLHRRVRSFAEVDAEMKRWILPNAARYPRVRFIHLNYAVKGDDASVVPIVALARMYGHEAFVALEDVRKTAIHDVYFSGSAGVPPAEQGASRSRPLGDGAETAPAQPARTPALRRFRALP